jgi:hypothetical protein
VVVIVSERGRFMEVEKLAALAILAVSGVLEICAKFGLIVVVEGGPASEFFFGMGEGALG